MQLSETDPNGILTSWQYDSFARRTTVTRPDGTSSVTQYTDCANSCLFGSHALVVTTVNANTDHSTLNQTVSYLDTVDRSIVSLSPNLSGGYDRNEVRYDSLGRTAQQAMPCVWSSLSTPCTYWSTITYDLNNRPTQLQRPISASNSSIQTTAISYQGRTTTVTDPYSKVTTQIKTVLGYLGQTQDNNGYAVKFSHDAFGAVLAVTDSASNPLSTAQYAYGVQAFPTSSTDMDLGARTYTFDALGELTGLTDAKSQSLSMTYDVLSRPLTRTEAEGKTTWTWGTTAGSYNIGRLQSVSSPGYSESSVYDSAGRLATRSITSDATYNYDYSYNATTELLDTLSYPTSTSGYRLKLQYGYANGLMQQIKDANASTVFWQANASNSRDQVTQETLGNGIVTNRAFDAVTGWISSIQSGAGGGASIQNESYLFDEMGNVTQRQNNNAGLTENFYYDSLYRLDHSTLGGSTNLQMAYDAMGDITSRSDVSGGATWTYDPTRKHAVTQTGSSGYSYTYDANGNVATRNGFSMVWSSYNYPTSINGNNKNMMFAYDANRQRYQQTYTSDSMVETTIYVGGLLEKVTAGGVTDWRHYIRAGNELVAIMSRQSSGSNATHYILTDHQGSLAKITDSTGVLTVAESFSAFGTRRDPNAWSGTPTCPDLCNIKAISREGFTGQDGIGGVSMGLNHMNGRVQDAIAGRFLSADPDGVDPANTQSFNRYSYVRDNPVSMTDPTGFVVAPSSYYLINNVGDNNVIPSLEEITVIGHQDDSPKVDVGAVLERYGISLDLPGPTPKDSLDPLFVEGKRPAKTKVNLPIGPLLQINFNASLSNILVQLGNEGTEKKAQSQKPPAPPPKPCYASRLNNPNAATNGKVGFLAGGTLATAGTLILLNIVGFPEAEAAEGALTAGYLLGLASGVGDAPLVAVSAGAYGSLVGTVFGIGITTPMCGGQSSPGG